MFDQSESISLGEEIAAVQQKVNTAVYTDEILADAPLLPGLILEILTYDPAVVRMALGEVGVHIRTFAEIADLGHPDLPEIAEGKIFGTRFAKGGAGIVGRSPILFRQEAPSYSG